MTTQETGANDLPQDADDIIVGGGHNGLVAACYLAMAGRRVCVLEARGQLGGAAISAKVFPGVDARLSKYSYLVSLLPERIREDLGLRLRTVRRRTSSYTPDPADPTRGLAVPVGDPAGLARAMARLTGSTADAQAWERFYGRTAAMADRVFDTLTRPLPSREELRAIVGDDETWEDFFVRPLGEVIERTFSSDIVRGIVLTDGLIGTFADAHDPSLHQNICFLYHVIGNGTGDWDVPLGGMGALSDALAERARALGVRIHTDSPVTAISSDGHRAAVTCRGASGERTIHGRTVLANCAPAVLRSLLGEAAAAPATPLAAGAQVKVNMLLKRLPKLRDTAVAPESAFNGTFHINESYLQLQQAHATALAGKLPHPLPVEIYCHSLTDPGILGPALRAAGAQTLTAFALHTPHHLFTGDHAGMRQLALDAVIASINSVTAEPIEDCLWADGNGDPCIEINTTVDIEHALGIPTGNIFHTPLDWPFSDDSDEVGTWGVRTPIPNVVLCGSGARRGGGVSGIPGHNAARHVLDHLR